MGLVLSLLELGVAFVFFLLVAALYYIRNRKRNAQPVVGFFHPFTEDGGGGERVLWCAVKAVQELFPLYSVVIYTGDQATPDSLAARASEKFGIQLKEPVVVARLYQRKWVEAATYPRFTLIGQSLGSVVLAWEALTALTPWLFVDTTGYAFTYPLARLFGCVVVCYTHYPTISSDMLTRVKTRTSTYNNNSRIARSFWLSTAKVFYYRVVARLYGWAGSCTHLAMVNSSWTRGHIEELWKIPSRTFRVYPPCDTSTLQALPLERRVESGYIISVAQFRPEKAHGLQLEAFRLALESLPSSSDFQEVRLKIVGSCRNSEDEERLQMLKDTCKRLKIDNRVDFCANVSYRELVKLLGGAVAGIHTMIDEHFGISVVEYMAAGAIPIAHRSAGPMMDIVVEEEGQQTGFLAETVEEYAAAIYEVFTLPQEKRLQMAKAARKRALRFSAANFDERFKETMKLLL
ncbi:alpha-1,2-mannosyltransferase [Marchantia polymorpha subsp. ruderalis]|uniref:GDP-Man:Man(3)GlcNAc(2)-PP-Dol alpha-1,2-mannosyltransferase n=2 Tax=Marchantia polymorpha TaxID=3197 RepID=A0AAF6ANE9_MARPO|nr:hypothetical protein MARPO_0096s0017 [Marchantia polymorpha]BBM97969.1 hypothetical protein Mp_1g09840 [Marchantia polymorpha subsp. ruderalis]|eukprot:PTQ32661.1 hypothetical protein MARPO_0096s0017 [Marchantia polymorpha]